MQVWYGWFRQDLTDDRDALLALPVDTLLGALKKSIAASIIPAPANDFLQQLAAALNTIAEHALTWERNAERVLELARQLRDETPQRLKVVQ